MTSERCFLTPFLYSAFNVVTLIVVILRRLFHHALEETRCGRLRAKLEYGSFQVRKTVNVAPLQHE